LNFLNHKGCLKRIRTDGETSWILDKPTLICLLPLENIARKVDLLSKCEIFESEIFHVP